MLSYDRPALPLPGSSEGALVHPVHPVLVPDLLHASPLTRIDVEHTKLAIALAFASGVSGGLFSDALDRATITPSSWEPEVYAGDLFLEQFVSLCFKIRIGAQQPTMATRHLANVLARPPDDVNTIHYRRAIVAELAGSPPLRHALEQLYLALCQFRTLLEGATTGRKWDSNRRQLDVLTAIKAIFDAMADGFVSAQSGLSRLRAFGQRVRAGEPYKALSDLLEYDEKLASVNLEVRVGADGKIRDFEIRSVQENRTNPFSSPAWRRWLAKIELFLRGYHFGEGEVMARLIDAVFDGVQDEVVHFVQLLGDIEFYLGALGFQDLARSANLPVCLPTFVKPDQPRALHGLFNPLLLAHAVTPVPCDVTTDRHTTTVLVTGPNSGGKTRLLQSVGLVQLLAQSGVFVPARSGTVALARGLVVSLLQETRADQSEGRLGMELVRIRALFERLPPGAMVLLDELCSGTNPSEGEEIFELVVRMLTRLGPYAFITTHFLAFAARLERQKTIPDLRFLRVVLGPAHEPTYQFAAGVAETSLAAHAAKRLGVTGEQLAALIEQNIQRTRS
ncbi:DNA mismatch repair protein [Pendulispora brunnea]|uniref:DNA mismatch repair protein n=1 Tax=Pendulispora brunnea TaxID=2905690 RepID=A0ABZ2JXM2_9BACT